MASQTQIPVRNPLSIIERLLRQSKTVLVNAQKGSGIVRVDVRQLRTLISNR